MKTIRIAVIGCGKTKQVNEKGFAIARELYTGNLFKAALAHAEAGGFDQVFILSAKYGLVNLEDALRDYDTTMTDRSEEERLELARAALGSLSRWYSGPRIQEKKNIVEVTVFAGAAYVEPLIAEAEELENFIIVDPLKGLQVGQRLAWFKAQREARAAAAELEQMKKNQAEARAMIADIIPAPEQLCTNCEQAPAVVTDGAADAYCRGCADGFAAHEARAEAPITCSECFRKKGAGHKSCSAPGCECYCSRQPTAEQLRAVELEAKRDPFAAELIRRAGPAPVEIVLAVTHPGTWSNEEIHGEDCVCLSCTGTKVEVTFDWKQVDEYFEKQGVIRAPVQQSLFKGVL